MTLLQAVRLARARFKAGMAFRAATYIDMPTYGMLKDAIRKASMLWGYNDRDAGDWEMYPKEEALALLNRMVEDLTDPDGGYLDRNARIG